MAHTTAAHVAVSQAWSVIKDTALDWYEDDAPRLAASLAYYALLSTAPLVLLAISIAGLAFGEEAARGQIAQAIGGVVGEQAAQGIQSVASNAHRADSGVLGSIVSIVVLLSSQTLLLGAEFIQVYARRFGSRIEPSKNAVRAKLETPSDAGARTARP